MRILFYKITNVFDAQFEKKVENLIKLNKLFFIRVFKLMMHINYQVTLRSNLVFNIYPLQNDKYILSIEIYSMLEYAWLMIFKFRRKDFKWLHSQKETSFLRVNSYLYFGVFRMNNYYIYINISWKNSQSSINCEWSEHDTACKSSKFLCCLLIFLFLLN